MSKGVVPGPLMFRDDTTFVMTVFVGLIIINIGMLFVGIVGTRPFAAVTKVPRRLLGPFVLALVLTGTYTYANYPPHVVMVLVLGLLAYLLEKIDFPVVPIVLAAVMGPIIETNLNRALTIQNGDLIAILSRPNHSDHPAVGRPDGDLQCCHHGAGCESGCRAGSGQGIARGGRIRENSSRFPRCSLWPNAVRNTRTRQR